jgi:hypothetical protein
VDSLLGAVAQASYLDTRTQRIVNHAGPHTKLINGAALLDNNTVSCRVRLQHPQSRVRGVCCSRGGCTVGGACRCRPRSSDRAETGQVNFVSAFLAALWSVYVGEQLLIASAAASPTPL